MEGSRRREATEIYSAVLDGWLTVSQAAAELSLFN